jgi:pimeloyl-ACP methyl ester carboxylesterase
MKDSQIEVGEGRKLAYTDIGDPEWPCVLFFHGAPITRLHLAYLEERFLAEKLRVVSPDRPGYGGSSPRPGRTLADWPTDVAALADALRIERFMVAGHSSGGPYAVASAALLPGRVTAAVALAGVTDMGWPGAWEAYFDSEAQLMRMADEESARAWCVERFGADGARFMDAAGLELSEPDNVLLADEQAGPAILSAMTEAFRQGVGGYAQDCFVQGRPWTFDPGRISVPVEVVHGDVDRVLPLAHSRHTSELIPGSSLRVLPGHGHLTILSELPALGSALARSSTSRRDT